MQTHVHMHMHTYAAATHTYQYRLHTYASWTVVLTEIQWPAGEDHRAALATFGSPTTRRMPTLYCCQRCGDLRLSGVTERRNDPFGLRDDDDDDVDDIG